MGPQPRAVAEVIEPLTVMEGAGVRLKRSIATARLDYLDPFLLFDHFGSDDPADYLPGFPDLPGGICNGITAGVEDEHDIAFLPPPWDLNPSQNWRWFAPIITTLGIMESPCT